MSRSVIPALSHSQSPKTRSHASAKGVRCVQKTTAQLQAYPPWRSADQMSRPRLFHPECQPEAPAVHLRPATRARGHSGRGSGGDGRSVVRRVARSLLVPGMPADHLVSGAQERGRTRTVARATAALGKHPGNRFALGQPFGQRVHPPSGTATSVRLKLRPVGHGQSSGDQRLRPLEGGH